MNLNTVELKKLRSQKGWTQQHLADVAGVSLRTIQRIEKTGSTSQETLSALCSVFGVERNKLSRIPDLSLEELEPIEISKPWGLISIAFIVGISLGAFISYLIAN